MDWTVSNQFILAHTRRNQCSSSQGLRIISVYTVMSLKAFKNDKFQGVFHIKCLNKYVECTKVRGYKYIMNALYSIDLLEILASNFLQRLMRLSLQWMLHIKGILRNVFFLIGCKLQGSTSVNVRIQLVKRGTWESFMYFVSLLKWTKWPIRARMRSLSQLNGSGRKSVSSPCIHLPCSLPFLLQ